MAIGIAIAALLVSLASVMFTYIKNHDDAAVRRSREYLDASNQLLRSAYEEFSEARSDDWSGLPKPSRLLWLRVARQIQESTDLAARITEKTHGVLSNQARGYWRGRFRDLLEPLKTVSITYFVEDANAIVVPGRNQRMCINEKSIRVILDFLKWPEGMPDPMEPVEQYTEAEVEKMWLFDSRPVAEFLQASAAMRSENEDRKHYWRASYQAAAEAERNQDITPGL